MAEASSDYDSGSGGGASDIRIGQDSLYARVIVAGGGGGGAGANETTFIGGYGGGTSGGGAVTNSSGAYNNTVTGGGATSAGTSSNPDSYKGLNGSFGVGGSYSGAGTRSGGGGGGGWYGGAAGSYGNAGGGGSGYVYTSSTASNYPSGCLLNSSYYLTDAQTIAGNTAFTSPTGTNETGHTGNGYIRITAIKAGSGNTLVKTDSTTWKNYKNIFINTGVSTTVPSGLVELEYIESTGTQYIDTEFKPNGNSGIIIDYQQIGTIESQDALFGARQTTSQAAFAMWLSSDQTYPQYGNVSYNTKPISITNNTRLIYKLDKGKASCGNNIVSFNQSSFSSNCNLTLFAMNTKDTIDSRRVSGKLYSCKIYDNDILIRNFIPAKRISDGKCGLWDKVNFKFYTDESGGNFTAGAEKTAIAAIGTPLEYIQSSGTQYINSNFIPKATTRTIMKAEPTAWSAWSAFFGTRNESTPTASQAYIAAIPTATSYRSDYFGSSLTAETPTVIQITNIDKNKNICSFNNIMITNTSSTVNTTTNMFLLALNDVGTAKYFLSAKLYSCQIYDGNTLVRDFIPVKTTTNI